MAILIASPMGLYKTINVYAQEYEATWTQVFPSPNPGERRSSAWASCAF